LVEGALVSAAAARGSRGQHSQSNIQRMATMKAIQRILLGLSIAVGLGSIAGCDLFRQTKLTIINGSSYDIDLVQWDGNYFGKDRLYDSVLGYYVDGIASGSSDTVSVDAGTHYITFWFTTPGPEYRTSSYVTVADGEHVTFTFYNSTTISQKGPTSEAAAIANSEAVLAPEDKGMAAKSWSAGPRPIDVLFGEVLDASSGRL
jgi:hypothetical protein